MTDPQPVQELQPFRMVPLMNSPRGDSHRSRRPAGEVTQITPFRKGREAMQDIRDFRVNDDEQKAEAEPVAEVTPKDLSSSATISVPSSDEGSSPITNMHPSQMEPNPTGQEPPIAPSAILDQNASAEKASPLTLPLPGA